MKPKWAPPSWLFGPVWAILYIVIAVTFGAVFINAAVGVIPAMICIPFILNLVFNAAFTPLQFVLRSNLLAFIDIVLVLISLIVSLVVIFPYTSWITLANIPYLFWVSFATILQLTITILNWN